MKLFINPQYNTPDNAHGGIRRVVEAMVKHLPDHGIEIVDSEAKADILNYHAGSYTEYQNKPMIASCHGLYWTNYKWDDHFHSANRSVIEVMARAQAVTVPSEWVKTAVTRGILHNPSVIYHGVDTEFWKPVAKGKNNHNYVLWNKARADIISNPNDLIEIADMMTDTKFVTTIGRQTKNIDVMGVVPYPRMVGSIKNAGVYLATARETMGIGTLEALASGIPVAGWDFGGQSEIITAGINGYLAPYGDYHSLKECITKCFNEREAMSKGARETAVNLWQWEDKIAQYADLFWDVYRKWYKKGPKFSIIVPSYNLAHYLPEALDSIKDQTVDNWECIIIDDFSTDNTQQAAGAYTANDDRFKYIKTPQNSGLCNVRNHGYKVANGRYLMYLDADDKIAPDALKTLGDHLDTHPGTHIAYGRIDFINHKGEGYREGDPPVAYNWLRQISHLHQFPIGAALIRTEALERSGGFRVRDWRAEDAAWIARVTSYGIRAHKATDDPILVYRIHPNSKSQQEARQNPHDIDGNWVSWIGWHMASNRSDGKRSIQEGRRPPWWIVPFGAQQQPEDPPHWNIDHHQDPIVSIIIPVGPNHDKYLFDTLDSLTAQTIPLWEAVIVNDTGQPLDLSWAPWARVIDTEGGKGAGYSRNLGAENARADLLYFLDSDDWLLSGALDAMIRAWIEQEGERYIYTNYVDINANGKTKPQRMKEYNQKEWRAQHAVNILINKHDFFKVGGFDPSLKGWEDWDLPLKLAISGLCGHHIADQTFVYRLYSGTLREHAVKPENQTKLLSELDARYGPYYKGGLSMSKCCGGTQAAQTILKAKAAYGDMNAASALKSFSIQTQSIQTVESVRMEYTGDNKGAQTFTRVNGRNLTKSYRGANSTTLKYTNAHPQDAQLLTLTGKWRIVPRSKRQTANLPAARPPAVNLDPPPETPADPIPFESDQVNNDLELLVSRAAEILAKKEGINLATLKGTGKNGKIILTDVRGAL